MPFAVFWDFLSFSVLSDFSCFPCVSLACFPERSSSNLPTKKLELSTVNPCRRAPPTGCCCCCRQRASGTTHPSLAPDTLSFFFSRCPRTKNSTSMNMLFNHSTSCPWAYAPYPCQSPPKRGHSQLTFLAAVAVPWLNRDAIRGPAPC
jgi:hypothetical protein